METSEQHVQPEASASSIGELCIRGDWVCVHGDLSLLRDIAYRVAEQVRGPLRSGTRRGSALLLLAGVALAGACARPASGDRGEDPPREPPARPSFERASMVRWHMQRHFEDLRTIERLLVGGRLDEAKTLAFMLTKPESDPGMAPWTAESRQVVEAARELVAARSIDEALRREARVAAACAECHGHTEQLPKFSRLPALPPDQPTTAARMARHQWAADRLWEGMIGLSDGRWRAGLEVLAATPLPPAAVPGAPALAARLQRTAREALERRTSDTLDDNARSYGDLLVTCAGCHAALPKPAGAAR